MMDIADDADDLVGRLVFVDHQTLANGVFAGKVAAREALADDQNKRRILFVTLGEDAPPMQWNAHRAEIIRADRAHLRFRFLPVRGGSAFDSKARFPAIAAQRKNVYGPDRFHAGNLARALKELLDIGCLLLALWKL